MSADKQQAVLDAIAGGLSQREAAAKFGVPPGTVAAWVARLKAGKVVRLAIVAPGPSRVETGPTKVALVRGKIAAEGLGPKLRGDIRDTVAALIGYTRAASKAANEGAPEGADSDWRPPDMRQIKAATGALADLLGSAADVLAFDDRTAATGDAPPDLATPDLLELLALDAPGFKQRFADTPILRTKRRGLLRNVCVALGNTGDPRALPALVKATTDPEPLIAEHATWAIAEIEKREQNL